jgi:hypothetical protein
MDYATHTIRAAAPAPQHKAKAAAQKRRAFPALPRGQERCRRNSVRPLAVCPAGDAAYGFLKTRFLPHFTGQGIVAAPSEIGQFYTSLDLLCDHYGIRPTPTQNLPQPYGQHLALYEAQRLLRQRLDYDIAIAVETDGQGKQVLCTTESYNTRNVLYYIPVIPLYQLLQGRRTKKAAQLLLCTACYLYHKAGIPYFGDEDTYLYWNYDRVSEWVLENPDDWESDDYNTYASQINTAHHIGEVMLRRIWNTIHLERFEGLVLGFVPQDPFGRECLAISKAVLRLWRDYPQANLYQHADEDCLPDPEEGYDDNDCVTMEKYISFCAATKGWLYDSIEQGINSDFGECGSIQEPVLRRCFDGRAQEKDSLDYECRLFALLDDVCYLLNNHDHDKR